MRRRCAFTLIELLVVISVIALLIGILLPALSSAKGAAHNAKCLANLHQLGIGATTYATNNRDAILPSAVDFGSGTVDLGYFCLVVDGDIPRPPLMAPAGMDMSATPSQASLSTYPTLNRASVFVCPASPDAPQTGSNAADGYWESRATNFDTNLTNNTGVSAANALILQCSYGLNGNNNHGTKCICQVLTNTSGPPQKMATILRAAKAVFMYDGLTVNPDTNTDYRIGGRHGARNPATPATTGSTNVAFFDGHSESSARGDLPSAGSEFGGAVTNLTHTKYIWRTDQQ